jgi:cell shape-determining protein MreD
VSYNLEARFRPGAKLLSGEKQPPRRLFQLLKSIDISMLLFMEINFGLQRLTMHNAASFKAKIQKQKLTILLWNNAFCVSNRVKVKKRIH